MLHMLGALAHGAKGGSLSESRDSVANENVWIKALTHNQNKMTLVPQTLQNTHPRYQCLFVLELQCC